MTPGEAASASAIARALRAEILAGAYDGEGLVPSRVALGKQYDVSAETASVALRMLAAEGLIRLEQGRRSAVLPVHRYEVTVLVPSSPRRPVGERELERAERRVRVQEDDDPAIGGASVTPVSGRLEIALTVMAADSGRAAARGMAVAVHALPADGWDFSGASVSARPA